MNKKDFRNNERGFLRMNKQDFKSAVNVAYDRYVTSMEFGKDEEVTRGFILEYGNLIAKYIGATTNSPKETLKMVKHVTRYMAHKDNSVYVNIITAILYGLALQAKTLDDLKTSLKLNLQKINNPYTNTDILFYASDLIIMLANGINEMQQDDKDESPMCDFK